MMVAKLVFVIIAAIIGAWLAGATLSEPISPRAWQWALVAVVLAGLAAWMGKER